jgi:hypothetical protein
MRISNSAVCYGYEIYISYITYPIILTQTLVIQSLHHSTYFLTYPFILRFTIKLQRPVFYLLHFSYFRVKDQHPQTYRIECSNLYSNTFLKWQAQSRGFRHLKTVLNHYINISSLRTDYYIPMT